VTVDMARWLVGCLGVYLAIGLAFALAFVALGIQRVDPAARGMPLTARVLLVPGAAALWPLLLLKWINHPSAPRT
jgi:hypothetical protein